MQLEVLESAIEQALRFRKASPAVVCVFHPDEFEEFRDPPSHGEPLPFMNLQELEKKARLVCGPSPGVWTSSIGDLAEDALESGIPDACDRRVVDAPPSAPLSAAPTALD